MIIRSVTRHAVMLGLFAVATAATLAITNDRTVDRIACNRQQALEASLKEVMPPAYFDNDLVADRITVSDPLLGRGTHHVWRARRGGEPAGAVIEAVAPDGYGGSIALLVGVDARGVVTGVRVVPPHNETPGLGDRIELAKSDWILDFDGRSLDDPAADGWAVKKDGGIFDAFAGATITPRAVVGQVKRALDFYHAGRDTLFAAPADDATAEVCP